MSPEAGILAAIAALAASAAAGLLLARIAPRDGGQGAVRRHALLGIAGTVAALAALAPAFAATPSMGAAPPTAVAAPAAVAAGWRGSIAADPFSAAASLLIVGGLLVSLVAWRGEPAERSRPAELQFLAAMLAASAILLVHAASPAVLFAGAAGLLLGTTCLATACAAGLGAASPGSPELGRRGGGPRSGADASLFRVSTVVLAGLALGLALAGGSMSSDGVVAGGAGGVGAAASSGAGMAGFPAGSSAARAAVVLALAALASISSALPALPGGANAVPTPLAAWIELALKVAGFAGILRVVGVTPGWSGAGAPSAEAMSRLLECASAAALVAGAGLVLRARSLDALPARAGLVLTGLLLAGVAALPDPAAGSGGTRWAAGGPHAAAGLGLQMLAHGAAATGLVLALDAIGRRRGTASGPMRLPGLARSDPFLAGAVAVFLASFAGLPATGAFWARWLILDATIGRGGTLLAAVGVLAWAAIAWAFLRRLPDLVAPGGAEPTSHAADAPSHAARISAPSAEPLAPAGAGAARAAAGSSVEEDFALAPAPAGEPPSRAERAALLACIAGTILPGIAPEPFIRALEAWLRP